MAKNFANNFNSTNDSVSLNQDWYFKLESSNGTFATPTATDFLFTLGGGSIAFSQPFESSPHRSGRHNTDIIKKKKECTWSLSTYFNIDETLGAAAAAEIDAPVKLLFKSLLGGETLTAGAVYQPTVDPTVTFSIYENGDQWARQSVAGFVDSCNMAFPGDGEATAEWSGAAKEAFLVGIGRSVVANAANTVTLGSALEGKRFPVGSQVMIVKSDGLTRSTDTPDGSARTVTAVAGAVVTLSGAVLTDAVGSGPTPIYLAYYEPVAKTAINNPVTGLVGSVSVVGLTNPCFRNASVNITQDHELVNYCFGSDSLDAPFFIPASRLNVEVTLEMNINKRVVEFYNGVQAFDAQDILIVLGGGASGTGRRLEIDLPKVRFPVPAFSVPDTGSIPVAFTGMAYQTVVDAADEIVVSFI